MDVSAELGCVCNGAQGIGHIVQALNLGGLFSSRFVDISVVLKVYFLKSFFKTYKYVSACEDIATLNCEIREPTFPIDGKPNHVGIFSDAETVSSALNILLSIQGGQLTTHSDMRCMTDVISRNTRTIWH